MNSKWLWPFRKGREKGGVRSESSEKLPKKEESAVAFVKKGKRLRRLDFMHPKVKPFSPEMARDLGLEESFIRFVMSDPKPLCFRSHVENFSSGWTCFVPEEVEVAYPVWSCNADPTILCIGGERFWFAEGYHDDPEINYIASTSQGVLAALFVSLYESGATELALKEGAQASGFRFLERVVNFSESDPLDFSRSEEKFIQEIDELAVLSISDEDMARITDYLRIDPEELNKRQIPVDVVEMLHKRKLVVFEPFPLSHAHYPCGRRVIKPASSGGNVLAFESRVIGGVQCNAPPTILYWRDEKWMVEISLPLGGEGPVSSYLTLDAAIRDILDLYFGSPERMQQLHQQPYASPAEVQAKATSLARAILDEKIILTEGVLKLAKLARFLGDHSGLINPFYDWSHELDRFPVGETRKLWNEEALAKQDVERGKLEVSYRDQVYSACQKLICGLKE